MDESVSRLILLYGLGFILAVGKACTLFIWQTLPKPRMPLRQEVREAWRRRRLRVQMTKEVAQAAPVETAFAPTALAAETGSEPVEAGGDQPAPDSRPVEHRPA